MSKLVLMVGGSQEGSIGNRIAEELYEQGYQLVVADRLQKDNVPEWLQELDLGNDPLEPIYEPINLRSGESLEALASWLGRYLRIHNDPERSLELHGVVYAAGVNHLGSVQDLTPAQFDEMVEVNARGVWLLTKALVQGIAPEDRAERVKTIVLGSNTAYVAKTRSFGYAFTKAGLVHMLRCMHRELAPQGWEFTSLDFGIVMDTDMTQKTIRELQEQRGWSAEQTVEMLLRNVPTGEPVSRSEIAAMVSFLLSDRARSFGGNSVRFDGGQQQG